MYWFALYLIPFPMRLYCHVFKISNVFNVISHIVVVVGFCVCVRALCLYYWSMYMTTKWSRILIYQSMHSPALAICLCHSNGSFAFYWLKMLVWAVIWTPVWMTGICPSVDFSAKIFPRIYFCPLAISRFPHLYQVLSTILGAQ